MSNAGLTATVEANLVTASAVFGRPPDPELATHPGLLSFFTPQAPHPRLNGVYRTRLDSEEADACIEEVARFYTAHRLPFSWLVGPLDHPADLGTRLESHGLAPALRLTGMAVDLDDLTPHQGRPPDAAVERVDDVAILGDFAAAVAAASELPESAGAALVDAYAPRLGESSSFLHFVFRADGLVVATSSLCLAGDVAGLWWVSTLPEVRGQGLGTQLTLTAFRTARERGSQTAVLLATPSAVGLYRRLGFESHGSYVMYVGNGDS